jgi:A/G-specific adenine glycosylase
MSQGGYVNTGDISKEDRARFTRNLLRWAAQNYRPFEWRRETDPYRVLLAEILLQRTQTAQVASNLQAVVHSFPTVAELASASEFDIASAIRPFGLTKRARTLSVLGKTICSEFAGEVPSEVALLQSLPGVGRYVASAVGCFAFKQAVPVVDANVIRVLSRYFELASQKKRARDDPALWEFVATLVPKRRAREFNWGLLDLAGLVCKQRSPKCSFCPLVRQCAWPIQHGNTRKG